MRGVKKKGEKQPHTTLKMSQGSAKESSSWRARQSDETRSSLKIWRRFSRFLATLQPGLVAPEDADQCGKHRTWTGPEGVVQLLPCNLLHRNEQAGFVSHWLASDAAVYQGVTVTKSLRLAFQEPA
ncbi:hypothetical protein OIU76_011364 [Salix suchowensis]|nr:hypothetical protein OIU76_011364 [Salix suchowensis]